MVHIKCSAFNVYPEPKLSLKYVWTNLQFMKHFKIVSLIYHVGCGNLFILFFWLGFCVTDVIHVVLLALSFIILALDNDYDEIYIWIRIDFKWISRGVFRGVQGVKNPIFGNFFNLLGFFRKYPLHSIPPVNIHQNSSRCRSILKFINNLPAPSHQLSVIFNTIKLHKITWLVINNIKWRKLHQISFTISS